MATGSLITMASQHACRLEVTSLNSSPAPGSAASEPPTRETSPQKWGRVAEDGTVFVRTSDGERQVGQWPDGDPDEVLAHFARKYDALVFEIDLLEQRVRSGTVAPDDAAKSLQQVRATVAAAQVVCDMDSLQARLGNLTVLVGTQREKRREERAVRLKESQERKQAIVEEAERIAAGDSWRAGADRLRVLLEEWKALPRLAKSQDDALWRRFSSARSAFTRRRKAHFAELDEKREGARIIKERLLKEAEALADSKEWGPTASAYRELMSKWKAAGPAPRGVEEQLWTRFRAAQDAFFGARDAAQAATDAEYAENALVKEKLLEQAEALLPVTDVTAAKAAFRGIADRWDAAGKVPRDRVKELEGRMRKVEQVIRGAEDAAWRRSNPEARARAEDTVRQLESSIADLEAKRESAAAAGREDEAARHTAAIEARQSWLTEAQRALTDFS